MTSTSEQAPNPTHKARFVTATALFDGHDASINIFRRLLQASGAEVIHLGHNRSGLDIVEAAIDEGAHAVAVTSYQGGHMEFYPYLRDLLVERGAGHIRIFGGGGGTILPSEADELAKRGVARIYSPDDGRRLGLDGMVSDMLSRCGFPAARGASLPGGQGAGGFDLSQLTVDNHSAVAALISAAEGRAEAEKGVLDEVESLAAASDAAVVGVTGAGGSGKSSLVDELVRRLLLDFADLRLAVVSVDPSKPKSGGALLGDRIRMSSLPDPRVYMRSLATRRPHLALSPHVRSAVDTVKAAGFDLVILETSGIGQSDTEIVDFSDVAVYVMTPEYGAATQLEKINMLDFADLIVINKADKEGALDALRDVREQWRRGRGGARADDDNRPIFPTTASDFNDPGVNLLYSALVSALGMESSLDLPVDQEAKGAVIPPERSRYLAEIAEEVRRYDEWAGRQSAAAERLYQLVGADEAVEADLSREVAAAREAVTPGNLRALEGWDDMVAAYSGDERALSARGGEAKVSLRHETLSSTRVPKVATPRYRSWGDRLRWLLQENVPGEFPYAAGVFPFRRVEEAPTRMFAGEGSPEQTNARFHYLAAGMSAKRLSTAFDSVTLYGEDPGERPDIYGKIGASGVSVATLDDAKRLYAGFDLADPSTSVSMTINGPAPMILAFFMNAAIDQACEAHISENGLWDEVEATISGIYGDRSRPRYRGDPPPGGAGLGLLGATGDQVLPVEAYEQIKAETLSKLRGTVQADILKEDQAQNTCIFSTEFALKMMGDIQEYFVENEVRNFYSVSISGYHMAEAGANPITQLAFTLANGLTYVEYYLARGMDIDDFAPNLSFFFSNGVDAEYAVIGRVARRIWAKAIRGRYGGDERSQKLKYHVQTSGRSLHAQEIGFNDIRTTLQALYAFFDNANSLHTNAYDEAITTPTEESVRRALAIQLIIDRELGLNKSENPLQGSFVIEELTDLVEEAVLAELERISSRGGVLGAMERRYQRTKIQEESLRYEQRKESGEYPIVGVNTFLSPEGSPFEAPAELIRPSAEVRDRQIAGLRAFQDRNRAAAREAIRSLQRAAARGENLFAELMETAKSASLGQMSRALYEVGGRYRRSM